MTDRPRPKLPRATFGFVAFGVEFDGFGRRRHVQEPGDLAVEGAVALVLGEVISDDLLNTLEGDTRFDVDVLRRVSRCRSHTDGRRLLLSGQKHYVGKERIFPRFHKLI